VIAPSYQSSLVMRCIHRPYVCSLLREKAATRRALQSFPTRRSSDLKAGGYHRGHRGQGGKKSQDQEDTCYQLQDWQAGGQEIGHRVIGVLAFQTGNSSGCTDAKEGAYTFDNEVST